VADFDANIITLAPIGVTEENYPSTAQLVSASQGSVYLMRGVDAGQVVFWRSPIIDANGYSYTGAGPLTQIKLVGRI
jgi:hypothetical protein